MRTVIAGGGLVGLTTAAALRLIGHEVTVLEQAPRMRAAGAGIGLWPNALREFDRIGVGADVRGMGEEIDTWFFDPAGHPVRADGYGADDHRFLLVPRPRLNDLLADAVGRDHVRLGARATGFTEHDTEVVVHLDHGEDLRTDLLIGADGVHSRIRARLAPGSDAAAHVGHFVWRAIVPSGDERPEGSVLTIGRERTRGGYARVAEGRTMWMVNQFDAGPLDGTKRDRALRRARHLAEAGWHDDLLRMIADTPEDAILENQVVLVPELPRWTTARVALIGDAAHGLSPHIAAGGTLGIEDVGVLRTALAEAPALPEALARYERVRMTRFDGVRKHSARVERAEGAGDFAARYAAFSHWMLTTAPAT
ncbi:FAD-dependent monooxygenase [Streptomyces sp. PTM05]|uniref:FAD-dependent monooxygenase n=1 Tax=Streptantibioticus parmotrematis TaxID=2873249 RepID=A0ABS7QQI0_9ACTN|nr:FAD-dependent monooxygenase [Streptantibioticus parmotrematis]MBY8885448.1 FAD-dependent monooxygenase [Streptantibioticus parmotrematis]